MTKIYICEYGVTRYNIHISPDDKKTGYLAFPAQRRDYGELLATCRPMNPDLHPNTVKALIRRYGLEDAVWRAEHMFDPLHGEKPEPEPERDMSWFFDPKFMPKADAAT